MNPYMANFFKLNSILILLICAVGTIEADGIVAARPYAAALMVLVGITIDDIVNKLTGKH